MIFSNRRISNLIQTRISNSLQKKKENLFKRMNNLEEESRHFLMNQSLSTDSQFSLSYYLLIVFESVRTISSICSVLGILGNIALIYVISKTSFRHVSYGSLIITVAFFDSIRLVAAVFYYFLFANIIPMNLFTGRIYLAIDRYPVFVVNWCKVLMSFERLLTIRYWEHHTHLDWRSEHKRKQHRRFICAIIFVLIGGLLIEHPNYLFQRYERISINYNRLMLSIQQNEKFVYGYYQLNSSAFTIISYLILDTTMPIVSILLVNILVLREVRRLPLSLQVKVKESIGILFFLTVLSIAIIPRVFICFYSSYFVNNTNVSLSLKLNILFYICLGFEYLNHAITGYACFLSSALLRSELKNMIWTRYISHHIP